MNHSRPPSKHSRGATAVCAAVLAIGACVDWEPVTNGDRYGDLKPVGVEVDAGPADASPEMRPCEACARSLSDPGCGNLLGPCNDDPPCKALFACSLSRRCGELATQDLIFECSYPCLGIVGITDPQAPAVSELFPMLTCMQTTCGPICRGEVQDN
jgi:hypothetical protein